jgi:hypothetical protein
MKIKLYRKCCKCGKEKELNEVNFYFYKSRMHRGILSYFRKECRLCYNIYMKKYNLRKRDTRKEDDKKYAKKIKDDITDRYIIKLIKRDNKDVDISELKKNKPLLELYRLRLQIKRQIRNVTKTN